MNLPFPWIHCPSAQGMGDPQEIAASMWDVLGTCPRSRHSQPRQDSHCLALSQMLRGLHVTLTLLYPQSGLRSRKWQQKRSLGLPHQCPRAEGSKSPRQGWARGQGRGEQAPDPRPQEAGCRWLKAQKNKLQDSLAVVKDQMILLIA